MKKIFKMLFYISFLFLFTHSISFYSQLPLTWQKLYSPFGGDGMRGYDVCPSDSVNFFLIGIRSPTGRRSYIIKIDSYGNTIWAKLIDSVDLYSGVASYDGGCIVTGGNYFNPWGEFSIKIDSQGNIIWKKFYDIDTNISVCRKIIKSYDNTFILCGTVNHFNAFIIKIDSSGNKMWERQFTSTDIIDFYYLCNAQYNGYTAVGIITHNPNDMGNTVITRVDDFGNLIWQKEYQKISYPTIHEFMQGYLVSGDRIDSLINRSRICIMKVDTSGNLILLKLLSYDSTNSDVVDGNINIINPNKYLISGGIIPLSNDPNSGLAMLLDSLGNIIKYKVFNETNSYFQTNYLINSNDFIIFGSGQDLFNQSMEDAYAIRTDSDFICPPIGIKVFNNNVPYNFYLYQNYPNPFNPETIIKYEIPVVRVQKSEVRLVVYDVLGRVVSILVDEKQSAGKYKVIWDAKNYASGVYFYQLKTENFTETKRMLMIK